MGAPKRKWTAEEEYALKAGIKKHGAGKWRTILEDLEFSSTLCLRSNIDLKDDKWRNMSVVMNGWGYREKARIALKKSRQIPKHDDNLMALSTEVANFSDEIVDGLLQCQLKVFRLLLQRDLGQMDWNCCVSDRIEFHHVPASRRLKRDVHMTS